MLNRTELCRLNATPILAGGFSIWRKDIILELGGFAFEFSSEDLEFTFRVQDHIIKKHLDNYKIIILPYLVGWTEGPNTIFSLLRQRNRWQRVTHETVWTYRHMLWHASNKAFTFLALPYFLFYEVFGVVFEVISIVLFTAGYMAGVIRLEIFLAFLTLIFLSQFLISLLALFIFIRDQRLFKGKDIFWFIVLGFTEFFGYHWLLVFAKLSGTVSFLMGKRGFDRYVRSRNA